MARALSALVALAATLASGAAWAGAALSLGPYVQDARTDGFTIAFETDREAVGVVALDGGARVETRGTRHEARLTGLRPGHRYGYRVLVDGEERARAETGTAPEPGASFQLVVYGDTRNGGETERAIAEAILAEHPELVVHTGDLTPKGDRDDGWRSFFANEAPLLAQVPLYLATGNHELWDDPEGEHVRRYFVPPGPEPETRARRYYDFRWGSAQLFVLDGNAHLAEQTAWLERALPAAQAAGARHLFVFVHQPPLSVGGHCGAAPAERAWMSLFERYGVRAVFGGHDHAYERMERNGVRYFVTGGGGAPIYEENSRCPAWDADARRVYSTDHHYLLVRVRGDEVEITAQRIPRGAPPIETVRFSAGQLAAVPHPPPAIDDGAVTQPALLSGVATRWPWAAAGLVLLLFVRRYLQKWGRS